MVVGQFQRWAPELRAKWDKTGAKIVVAGGEY
jgi:hypothetical protein